MKMHLILVLFLAVSMVPIMPTEGLSNEAESYIEKFKSKQTLSLNTSAEEVKHENTKEKDHKKKNHLPEPVENVAPDTWRNGNIEEREEDRHRRSPYDPTVDEEKEVDETLKELFKMYQ